MGTRRDPRARCERPDGKVTIHENLSRALVESDDRICRNGFQSAVLALFDRIGQRPADIPLRGFLPDAYMIDDEAEELIIFEVEITCPLSRQKLHDYGMFWFDWDSEDEHEWLPRLIVVDRYGHRNELNMQKLYLGVLAGHAPDPEKARIALGLRHSV